MDSAYCIQHLFMYYYTTRLLQSTKRKLQKQQWYTTKDELCRTRAKISCFSFYSRERMKTFFLLDFEGVELLIGSSENSKDSNPVMHLVGTSFCCFKLFMSSWSFSIFACISSITAVTSCFSTLLEGREGDWSFNPSFVILLPPAEMIKLLKIHLIYQWTST